MKILTNMLCTQNKNEEPKVALDLAHNNLSFASLIYPTRDLTLFEVGDDKM